MDGWILLLGGGGCTEKDETMEKSMKDYYARNSTCCCGAERAEWTPKIADDAADQVKDQVCCTNSRMLQFGDCIL